LASRDVVVERHVTGGARKSECFRSAKDRVAEADQCARIASRISEAASQFDLVQRRTAREDVDNGCLRGRDVRAAAEVVDYGSLQLPVNLNFAASTIGVRKLAEPQRSQLAA
jgi:hypothetical protein